MFSIENKHATIAKLKVLLIALMAELSRAEAYIAARSVFLRAKKLWVNPPKAERAKPSLSLAVHLLFL